MGGRTLPYGGGEAVSAVTTGLRGYRFSGAPSGGTQASASAIAKFITSHPNSSGQIFTANPTVTTGAQIFVSPPGIDKRSGNTHQVDIPPGAGPFVLIPGEGLVVRQTAGIVGLFWNVSVVWREA